MQTITSGSLATGLLGWFAVVALLWTCAKFALSLRRGDRALITRIAAEESPEQAERPEVIGYTRRLTGLWAMMCALQAAVLLSGLFGWYRLSAPLALGLGYLPTLALFLGERPYRALRLGPGSVAPLARQIQATIKVFARRGG